MITTTARVAAIFDCSIVFARWRPYVPPTNTWFLGASWINTSNGISIGSSVFVGLTGVPEGRYTHTVFVDTSVQTQKYSPLCDNCMLQQPAARPSSAGDAEKQRGTYIVQWKKFPCRFRKPVEYAENSVHLQWFVCLQSHTLKIIWQLDKNKPRIFSTLLKMDFS